MQTIKQRRGFETRTFRLDEAEGMLHIEEVSFRQKSKHKTDVADIGDEIEYVADNTIAGKIIFTFTLLMALCFLLLALRSSGSDRNEYAVFCIGSALFSLFNWLKPHRDNIVIANGHKIIQLFRDSPDEATVLDFVQQVVKAGIEKRKEFLTSFELNEHQFMNNILWLLQKKQIDQAEYDELKSAFRIKQLSRHNEEIFISAN